MQRLLRAQPVLLAVWPYLLLLVPLLPDPEALSRFLWVYLPLTPALYLLGVPRAGQLRRQGDAAALVRLALRVKLAHIPFYLAVFLLGLLTILVMVVPAFVLLSPLLLLTMAVCDWLLMAASSWYALGAVRLLRNRGILSAGQALAHTACLFCFVLDVLAVLRLNRLVRSLPQ